jgi:formylglycine-generating enzyme required for sulfatase activity
MARDRRGNVGLGRKQRTCGGGAVRETAGPSGRTFTGDEEAMMHAWAPLFGIVMAIDLCSPCVGQAPLSPGEERALKAHDSFKECVGCPEMVVVPAGAFVMGSPEDEAARDGNEGPQRPVQIGRPFALGKFEVTVGEFGAFVRETSYDTGSTCDVWQDGTWAERAGYSWRNPGFPQSDAHPAACLSWDDAKAYLAWLSRKTGKTYRLPTEAEWEYAARAGATTTFHFGNDRNDYCRHGNGADQTAQQQVPGAGSWSVLACRDGHAYTAPVGSFAANAFGLHDALGNVFEWVEDCWNDSYAGAPTDGSAWTSGDCTIRVQRGGAWGYPPDYLRTAVRGRQPQAYRYVNAGIRVARTLGP